MKNKTIFLLAAFWIASAAYAQKPGLVESVMTVVDAYHGRLYGSDSATTCKGRLTLTSGTAITTSDVTAATTVYFTPLNGAQISLYSDAISAWQIVTFSETSVAVPATTSTPFDIFAYSNSGTLALTTVNWTNTTTRATSLTTQNGILVSSSDSKYRYLGTAMTTTVSGQTEDSIKNRLLWNMYNRVPRKFLASKNTSNWAYSTPTWRAADNDTTIGNTAVGFVIGQPIEPVKINVFIPETGASTSDAALGVGIDSTSSNSADLYGGASNGNYPPNMCHYMNIPSAGYHYGQWLEIGASGTINWFSESAGNWKGGLFGEIWG